MVETRTVKLTSPDRVLFPEDGITKGDLFEYYRKAGPTIVPHLRDRPFTMKRYREGSIEARRATTSGQGHHRVVEEEARRRSRRPSAERPREDDCVGVFRAPEARRAGFHAAPLGGADLERAAA